jgi:hypothetical protein
MNYRGLNIEKVSFGKEVETLEDMPTHHSHGGLFIGKW